jgi:murein DD-endopeptidase MepM/ murein hydrolase activator NlpD
VSRTSARHRKPPRYASPRRGIARHRKPSPVTAALQNKPVQVAAAVAGSALIVSAGPAATHGLAHAPSSAGLGQADAVSLPGASPYLGRHAAAETPAPFQAHPNLPAKTASASKSPAPSPARHRKPSHHTDRRAAPSAPAYLNPFRGVSGLLPERIDEGVDFGGAGPVYALGDGVVTNATGSNYGWPGGGWITYKLTDGPDAGLMVYVAEDVRPTVQAGQQVTSSTVIAEMFEGGDGIETGWAMPNGASAESQLAEAGGISGYGPFPTKVGLNFEELLQSVGVPAANNAAQTAYGVLPPNYPTSW